MVRRLLLEALGPLLLLEQDPLEAHLELEVVYFVPPHLLVQQVSLHLVQAAPLPLVLQPCFHLVLQAHLQ